MIRKRTIEKIEIIHKPAWDQKKKILVILAHPDDPEFFCGATLAKWALEGHSIQYCILTRGERGTNDHFSYSKEIKNIREAEQNRAAAVIGAREVIFLDEPDGFVHVSDDLKRTLVKMMRQYKPNIVVSCDPRTYLIHGNAINHPDHRAAGQAVFDCIFPAVQNEDFYPDLKQEGIQPHQVEDLWLSLTSQPDIYMDVTKTWHIKIEALLQHSSQIAQPHLFQDRMTKRTSFIQFKRRYIESFKRIHISH